jgi:hypothetical protein
VAIETVVLDDITFKHRIASEGIGSSVHLHRVIKIKGIYGWKGIPTMECRTKGVLSYSPTTNIQGIHTFLNLITGNAITQGGMTCV